MSLSKERKRIINELYKFKWQTWYIDMEFNEIKKIINNTKDKSTEKTYI